MTRYYQNKNGSILPHPRRGIWRWWDLRTLNVLLVALITTMFMGFLALNNQAAANGFTIKAIEKRIADLEEQRRKLDLEVLGRQSMNNVESQVRNLGFVPVSGIDYLTAAGGAVAFK